MNLKLFVIVMFSAMLITIGVGNLLTAPAASPCQSGQCTIPQETAMSPPVVTPTAPEICDGEPAESCDDGECRAPLRKAAKAPIKTVGSAGRIATKPLKVFRVFRRRR